MAIKILMTWDIRPDKEAEYFEFVSKEFAPTLMRLGVQPTEAWYTAYGDGPQILTGAVAPDIESMREAMNSDEWRNLKAKLLRLVENYEEKFVHDSSRFQL
ncbi:MAG: hypothetical protein QHH80_08340 [Anaerolineae bacterium]|nr:hypothetical protein [Anaerolineae bacterium]